KRFEDDEVFGRTHRQRLAVADVEGGGALDTTLFEGHGAQGDVERHSGRPVQQQHPMSECEVARTVHASDERREQLVDVSRLLTEAGQQRAIDVQCQTRFAPSLDGKAADETEAPATRLEKSLELEGGRKKRVHVSVCGEGIARTRSTPTR